MGLGIWQLERLRWKEGLIATVEAGLAASPQPLDRLLASGEALGWRHATAEGGWLPDRAFAFGVAAQSGEIGAELVMPLRLADGQLLLVDRGWLPEALLPPRLPPALAASAPAAVTGVLREIAGARQALFAPDNDPARRRWYWWDGEALARWLGAPALPVTLTLEAPPPGEMLPAARPVEVDLPNNHLQYAVTWFSLAVSCLVIYLLARRRP